MGIFYRFLSLYLFLKTPNSASLFFIELSIRVEIRICFEFIFIFDVCDGVTLSGRSDSHYSVDTEQMRNSVLQENNHRQGRKKNA